MPGAMLPMGCRCVVDGLSLCNDGRPPPGWWAVPFSSVGCPLRIDGLSPFHQWAVPFPSVDCPLSISGLPLSISGLSPFRQRAVPFSLVSCPLLVDGLCALHRSAVPPKADARLWSDSESDAPGADPQRVCLGVAQQDKGDQTRASASAKMPLEGRAARQAGPPGRLLLTGPATNAHPSMPDSCIGCT